MKNEYVKLVETCAGGMAPVPVTMLQPNNNALTIPGVSDERLQGGLGDGRSIEEFDPVQVVKGIKVEMEHSDNIHDILEIVKDHLTENPKYYSNYTH